MAFNKSVMNKNVQLLIKEKSDQGILRLTMNDLVSKNSLSEEMMCSLINEFKNASKDSSIKVIILAGNGNVFSAGHNLKEITTARENEDEGEKYFKEVFNLCSTLMQLIIDVPQPVIAEVDGIATAAGCQLVASCDLAIATQESKFATPGVNIGLFCSTPMVALSRSVGRKDAMQMLLTGDLISAKKAKEIGLINDVIGKNELDTAIKELTTKIASKSFMTIKTGKKAFYAQAEMNLSKAYEYTSKVMAENLLKNDAKEGIDAFINKRSPDWKDE
jgi:enoyl-CoA hydratase/carnithine racemase